MRTWWIVSRALVPLAVRHLATHARMASVAGVAIACGVATHLATQVLHGSALATYEETTSRLAGRAALQVSNGDAGVGEEIADDVRRVPGVGAVASSVEGFVGLPDFPGERLYLCGVDLLADQEVRDYGAGATAVVTDPSRSVELLGCVAVRGEGSAEVEALTLRWVTGGGEDGQLGGKPR